MPFLLARDQDASERILVRWLWRHAARAPQRTALNDLVAGRAIDWRELAGRVLQTAEQLRRHGVQPRHTVAVALANSTEAIILTLAIQQLGACEAAIGNGLDATELARRSRQVEAKVLIVDSAAVARQAELALAAADRSSTEVVLVGVLATSSAPSLTDNDLRSAYWATSGFDPAATALVLWTSGTQSQPRGAMLSHHALASNAAGKLAAVPQTPGDRRLTVLPLYHAYARTCDLGTWLISGGQLATDLGWAGLVRGAPLVRPTLINMVPSLALKLLGQLQSADDTRRALQAAGLECLRLLGCGGAPLAAEEFSAFRELGIHVIHGYGLTEAGPVVCSATPAEARPGTVGKPVPGVRLRIDHDQRLWMQGPGVMQGYWGDGDATAKKRPDGWLDTGDLARLEDDGQVTILGRADDTLVLPNGRKLQPLALEQACCRLPSVRHAVLCLHEHRLTLLIQCQETETPTDAGGSTRGNVAWRSELETVIAAFPYWQRPERIVRLPRPLSHEASELTAKGTVRRGNVIKKFQQGEYW